jgi:flagellar biogenesis protein FliO
VRFDSSPDYKTIKDMKNKNLKAIVGLVLAIALVVVMGYILKLTNNI